MHGLPSAPELPVVAQPPQLGLQKHPWQLRSFCGALDFSYVIVQDSLMSRSLKIRS